MLNVVAIMGRLVADPELRTTPSGVSVCTVRIACDRNFVQQSQERQADFLDVVAWRGTAEFISKYFSKGSMVAVHGHLQTRNYKDKNGNSRTAVEIVTDDLSFAGPSKRPAASSPWTTEAKHRPGITESLPRPTRRAARTTLPSSTTTTICRFKGG